MPIHSTSRSLPLIFLLEVEVMAVLLVVVMLECIAKVGERGSGGPLLLVRRVDHLLMCVCEASERWKSNQ